MEIGDALLGEDMETWVREHKEEASVSFTSCLPANLKLLFVPLETSTLKTFNA